MNDWMLLHTAEYILSLNSRSVNGYTSYSCESFVHFLALLFPPTASAKTAVTHMFRLTSSFSAARLTFKCNERGTLCTHFPLGSSFFTTVPIPAPLRRISLFLTTHGIRQPTNDPLSCCTACRRLRTCLLRTTPESHDRPFVVLDDLVY